MSFQLEDDNKTVLKFGAFLHVEEKNFHTHKDVGNSVGRLLCTIVPAGFENFFAEAGIYVKNKDTFSLPSMNSINILKIMRIANEKYGPNINVPNQEK